MAEEGEMTADEYKTYYQKGYKTDITNIDIAGDHITFTYENGKKAGTDYKYIGYYIQNWSTGTKAAMYRFEAVDRTSGAPIYIEFNDHMIESAAAEHFHIRMSNESFDAIVDPENSWPTFFPADMTGEELCEHMEGHGHAHEEETDEHVWLSLRTPKRWSPRLPTPCRSLIPTTRYLRRQRCGLHRKAFRAGWRVPIRRGQRDAQDCPVRRPLPIPLSGG